MLLVSFILLYLCHGFKEDDVILFLYMNILLAFHTLCNVQWMIEHSKFHLPRGIQNKFIYIYIYKEG